MRRLSLATLALVGSCGGTPSNTATIVDGEFSASCQGTKDSSVGGGSATLQLTASSDGTWTLANATITVEAGGGSTALAARVTPSSIPVHAGNASVQLGIYSPDGQAGNLCLCNGMLPDTDTWHLDLDVDTGAGILHVSGVTQAPNFICAISRRAMKRDIAYVSDEEREQIAAETLAIPLASYRYKSEPERDKKHLGFIIDDQPDPSPAIQSDRTHVDEYGYTSMLLATVQEQQKQIDALTRKVDALQKQCR